MTVIASPGVTLPTWTVKTSSRSCSSSAARFPWSSASAYWRRASPRSSIFACSVRAPMRISKRLTAQPPPRGKVGRGLCLPRRKRIDQVLQLGVAAAVHQLLDARERQVERLQDLDGQKLEQVALAVAGLAIFDARPVEQPERRVVPDRARIGRGRDARVGRGAQHAELREPVGNFAGEVVQAEHDSNIATCCNTVNMIARRERRSAKNPNGPDT